MNFSWIKKLISPRASAATPTGQQKTSERKAKKRLEGLEEIKAFLQPDSTYLFDMEISLDSSGRFLADCPAGHVHGTQIGGTCVDTSLVADSVKMMMSLNYDFNAAAVHYKKRDSDLIINGEDETIGLPVGTGYQVLVIPEKCPNPPRVPPASKQPGGVCGLRRPAP